MLFQTEAYFKELFQHAARQLRLRATTPADFQAWQQTLRAKLHQLLRLHRMQSTPLNPRITETVQCKGYRRQRVEIDTEPGVTMPLYVLIPDDLLRCRGFAAPPLQQLQL